jgi:hypothetical protein
MALLRKHSGLVVQRTIPEVKDHTVDDAITLRVLDELAICQEIACR